MDKILLAYVNTAIKAQCKLYDSYNCLNDHSDCYALLDSLDVSFKKYIEDCLPNDFCFLIIWMHIIKALQSKTMKHELENLKPQQYTGQNVAVLTTAAIWDHQLCSSILSAFLVVDSNEMYCHSLITMKATLEDKLRKVRFMEHAAGATHLHSRGLTYANICDLAETWYQKSKGVAKWPPATHAKDSKALPSPFHQAEVNAFV